MDRVQPIQKPGIVEILAGLSAQRPELFGESLDVIVGKHLNPVLGHIRIGMEDFRRYRFENDSLVSCEIELDPGQRMRRRDRPLVTDLALAGDFAARIREDFELLLIDRDSIPLSS